MRPTAISLSEVGHFTASLRAAFESGGQLIATSHTPEAIQQFSSATTMVLFRKGHLEPTQIRPVSELDAHGDLIYFVDPRRPSGMSANKALPHLLVLPEDDANRDLAKAFLDAIGHSRQVQVIGYPRGKRGLGWDKTINELIGEYAPRMRRHPHAYALLLIDFDGDPERSKFVRERLQQQRCGDVAERVFVLGSLNDPEDLLNKLKRDSLGLIDSEKISNKQDIGKKLAVDCRDGSEGLWSTNSFVTTLPNSSVSANRCGRSCSRSLYNESAWPLPAGPPAKSPKS